jgi:hypothetical protein
MTTRAVYKYDLSVDDRVELALPLGAEVLTVQEQHGKPRLWALVDPESETFTRRIFVYVGTGHTHPAEYFENLKYITTFQMLGGKLVWHVFEDVLAERKIDGGRRKIAR